MRRIVIMIALTGAVACDRSIDLPAAVVAKAFPVPVGRWVGEPSVVDVQMSMVVEPMKATWGDSGSCESGVVTSGPLVMDDQGRFAATGTVRFWGPGSGVVGLTGTVDGLRMTVEFAYADGTRRLHVLTLGRATVTPRAVC
jgi:hypothetical protein